MAWERIERVKGSTDVRPHPRDAAMVLVTVRLTTTPPNDWRDRFTYPSGHSSRGEGSPVLDGGSVSIGVNEGAEQEGVAAIDERIARANQEYERDVLPAVVQHEEQEKRRADSERQRLEAARKRVKDL
jgi:hypothetical protein